MTDPVELTKKLVKIESCNPGVEEGRLGDYIYERLETRGVPVRKQQVLPGRFNIIAKIEGNSQKPPLVMICHMDTVVVGDGWTAAPFAAEEKNGRIYGRGACDMKSGFACALSSFEELWEEGTKPERTIYFIATVDEEADMNGIQAVLREGLIPEGSLMMDLEPTGLAVSVCHKGRIWYHVQVQGVTAHASTPWKGVDAIAAAAEFISEIRGLITSLPEHPEMGATTVTFGQISGGYQPYVVPDLCKITLDIRTVPPYGEKDIEALMIKAKSRAEARFTGIRLSWECTGNRPYVYGISDSELCTALFEAYRKVCGQDAKLELFPGYTDTAVAAVALNNYNCVSFGPGRLEMAHKPNEYVEIEQIILCKRILKSTINRLCFHEK
ncbi:MAG: peptidase M20 [Firmicutes bacterium HGW-Firmicutes-16]|nr:MAG: peptidase M20 [Firmicutes bacterium HGW-Firmicutes-16]